MRIAIMQPYLFAYPGYFELLASVDKFILYDDVNYIKNGWINRNRIAINDQPVYFTVPLQKQSSFRTIAETSIHKKLYSHWKLKFLLTLKMQYSQAPYYSEVYDLVQKVIDPPPVSIAALAGKSVVAVADYLGLEIPVSHSSDNRYGNHDLKAEKRVLDICRQEGADEYVNNAGGIKLYSPAIFQEAGITLHFLHPRLLTYAQQKEPFIPNLSILDAMMHLSPEQIQDWLRKYRLQTPIEKPVLR
ncbi:MAG: WbqC family protein [Bacteroidia bacterium]